MMIMQLELVEFVKEPSWREILLESIDSQQMNPWEVDLVKIADAYLQKVKEMQSMDLRVPANVILASALLLRYKAQALSLEEPAPLEEEPLIRSLIDESIPDLILNPNNPRSRTLTLEELISAVEEVMGIERRELRPRLLAPPLQIELPKENIGEMMKIVHGRAHELKDSQNILLFSELVHSFNGHGEDPNTLYVLNLLPVLHLIQEERMFAWQDRLFGEIFLKVLN
jgi:chromatin segregation and condensation protein Rec8/ScpA/Scc1 (kleisin family)